MAASRTGRMITRRSDRPVKIVLKGYFGVGNFGDDILLSTVSNAVRTVSDLPVVVHCAQSADYLHKQVSSPMEARLHSEAIFEPHILIYAGGGQFFGFRKSRLFETLRQACLRTLGVGAARLMTDLVASRTRQCESGVQETAAIGVGLGPFHLGSAAEYRAALQLNQCSYLNVRDNTSLKYALRWKLNVRPTVAPDISFATRYWLKQELRFPRKRSLRQIGIIVRAWPHTEAPWIEKLQSASLQLRKLGYETRIITLCRRDDRNVLAEAFSGADIHSYNPEDDTPASFCSQLLQYDAIVSCRAHGVFIAAILGIPCIAVSIEPKLSLAAGATVFNTETWEAPWRTSDLVSMIESADRKGTSDISAPLARLQYEAERSLLGLQAWIQSRIHR